ncbi:hypothetical protein [Kitasatospora cinereorecta]|uniref:Uncharacterized protein n=1 Tax=Kitasatospora cinereorecta TaxID=285560 RepID=A0ABW0V314_9ACTN
MPLPPPAPDSDGGLRTRDLRAALDLVLAACFTPGVHRVAVSGPDDGPVDRAAQAYGLHRYRVPPTDAGPAAGGSGGAGAGAGRLDVDQLLRLPVKGILLDGVCDGLERLLDRFPGLVVAAGTGPAPCHPQLVLLRADADGCTVRADPSLLAAVRDAADR